MENSLFRFVWFCPFPRVPQHTCFRAVAVLISCWQASQFPSLSNVTLRGVEVWAAQHEMSPSGTLDLWPVDVVPLELLFKGLHIRSPYFAMMDKTTTLSNCLQIYFSVKFRIVFWNVLPCKIIVDRRFRGACCLHQQGSCRLSFW
jgi:hypothetical protein